MKALNWIATVVATASVMFTGCKSDDEATLSAAEIEAAQTTLNGDIVVSAHAWINGEDKTLLSSGAPIKLNFEKSDGDKMNVWMDAIQIGSMPFTVYFGIVIEFAPLNSWEKGELTDDGWVRFSGSHGNISYGARPSSPVDTTTDGDGSTMAGYVNTKTNEIQFTTSFTAMNVEISADRQDIDPSRVENYEAEKEQYEKDLEEYKKTHNQ